MLRVCAACRYSCSCPQSCLILYMTVSLCAMFVSRAGPYLYIIFYVNCYTGYTSVIVCNKFGSPSFDLFALLNVVLGVGVPCTRTSTGRTIVL